MQYSHNMSPVAWITHPHPGQEHIRTQSIENKFKCSSSRPLSLAFSLK